MTPRPRRNSQVYDYDWDAETGGYLLNTRNGRFVANEIRPVFAEELALLGLDKRLRFEKTEKRPLLWAQKNHYLLNGEKIAQVNGLRYGAPVEVEYFFEGIRELRPVDTQRLVHKNVEIMGALVSDTKRRAKELYDDGIARCDIAYIAFSGGKDSVALLNLCHEVLPLQVPVIFSDTDMELPDTYKTWDDIKKLYPERQFICAKASRSARENWRLFGPPSRAIRWCCSVHKSTPALITLKSLLKKDALKAMAFVGVRGEESLSRSSYSDANEGVKNASQMNRMPLLDWGAHELWLYILAHDLYINRAYRAGLSRVGCVMCPESASKHLAVISMLYPDIFKDYAHIIIGSSSKSFKNTEDALDYVGTGNWHARKSGATLNDTISAPVENTCNLTSTFRHFHLSKERLLTWLKPLGNAVIDTPSGGMRLQLPRRLDEGVPFAYKEILGGGGELEVNFRSEAERLELTPLLRTALKKASACVGCRACEAECTHGALSCVEGVMQIDGDKCLHCRQCFDKIANGCWRYNSLRVTENSKSFAQIINSYATFGLREKDSHLWVSTLVDMRDKFFPWNASHPLGTKMMPSCKIWFQQALLIDEQKKPTLLVDLFAKEGGSSPLGWEFIWMALVNRSEMIKWFVTATEIGVKHEVTELTDMLKCAYSGLTDDKASRGLAAFKDLVSKSPLGAPVESAGEGAMMTYEMKGRSVNAVTRLAKEVRPLTVLYGLYLIAQIAEGGTFTINGMMDGDIDSKYISPIQAFGIKPADFKRLCEGLRSRYPDYIATTFTHGNDEVRVFPERFNTGDIVTLALKEA